MINNIPNLATAQEAKTMTSILVSNNAHAERSANLMNIICMRLGNSLIVDDISRLTTILLLGMDATPLNHSCNATTVEFGKNLQ